MRWMKEGFFTIGPIQWLILKNNVERKNNDVSFHINSKKQLSFGQTVLNCNISAFGHEKIQNHHFITGINLTYLCYLFLGLFKPNQPLVIYLNPSLLKRIINRALRYNFRLLEPAEFFYSSRSEIFLTFPTFNNICTSLNTFEKKVINLIKINKQAHLRYFQ